MVYAFSHHLSEWLTAHAHTYAYYVYTVYVYHIQSQVIFFRKQAQQPVHPTNCLCWHKAKHKMTMHTVTVWVQLS